jgi:hypothetical protein
MMHVEEKHMELEIIPSELTICKLSSTHNLPFDASFFFLGKTDQEVSLVCKTEDTPAETLDREDGWRGFRIKGILDFTQIGVLSSLSGILARNQVSIFVVSTYNTDYLLIKAEQFENAMHILTEAGYDVL